MTACAVPPLSLDELEETLVDRETGIVSGLYECPAYPHDPAIFIYAATVADIATFFPEYGLEPTDIIASGAGLTRDHARGATLGEAVERYCINIYDRSRFITGSYRELTARGYQLTHPSDFCLFDRSQYAHIPFEPFTEDARVEWVPGRSLTRNCTMLVPANFVYVGYEPPAGCARITYAISTGAATATSYEEAVLKGIMEAVERDALMITWFNRLPAPHIDMAAVPGVARLMAKRFQWHGLEYHMLDMTTDLPFAAVITIIIDHNRTPVVCSFGSACHIDRDRAAMKALIEAVHTRQYQMLLRRRGNPAPATYEEIYSFEDHVRLYGQKDMRHAVRFLVEPGRQRAFTDLPHHATGNLQTDMARAVAELASRGMDVVVVDLATEDVRSIGLHVTKAIIPPLQQMNAPYNLRFLGGRRLYEVPMALGYRDRPSTIAELNPDPHPLP